MTNIYDKMPKDITGWEDWNWYDGIAYYEDKEWNRYSRNGNPIEKDEMCKYWKIYKVRMEKYGEWKWDYRWKILSEREDLL